MRAVSLGTFLFRRERERAFGIRVNSLNSNSYASSRTLSLLMLSLKSDFQMAAW